MTAVESNLKLRECVPDTYIIFISDMDACDLDLHIFDNLSCKLF